MGSPREALAMSAFFRNQNIQFMTTLSIVNAIIHVGNSIAAASSGSNPSSGGADTLKKSMESLRDLLLPEDVNEKESKAERALKMLTEEAAKGPLMVRPKAVTSRKSKGKITRRRGPPHVSESTEP